MNQTSHIQHLLDLFFEGDTTLQQEQELMDYFRGNSVAAELMEYRPMFLDLAAAQEDTMPHTVHTTTSHSRLKRLWPIAIAACLAGLAFTFILQRPTTANAAPEQPQVLATIYGQEITDQNAVLQMMEGTLSEVLDNGSDEAIMELTDILNN